MSREWPQRSNWQLRDGPGDRYNWMVTVLDSV